MTSEETYSVDLGVGFLGNSRESILTSHHTMHDLLSLTFVGTEGETDPVWVFLTVVVPSSPIFE